MKRSWQQYVELAAHYRAIEQTDIYLMDGEGPWSCVTRGEVGGSHRLEIATSYRFFAEHPSGLTFSWVFDLEPRGANGKGSYEIDVAGVLRICRLLPDTPRAQFTAYLADCADKVQAKANEYRQIADRQAADARALLSLSRELEPATT